MNDAGLFTAIPSLAFPKESEKKMYTSLSDPAKSFFVVKLMFKLSKLKNNNAIRCHAGGGDISKATRMLTGGWPGKDMLLAIKTPS